MENEILRAAAEKRGGPDPAGEATQIAMEHQRPVAVVFRVLGRASVHGLRPPSAEDAGPSWAGDLDR
jgi:hypothetical protein